MRKAVDEDPLRSQHACRPTAFRRQKLELALQTSRPLRDFLSAAPTGQGPVGKLHEDALASHRKAGQPALRLERQLRGQTTGGIGREDPRKAGEHPRLAQPPNEHHRVEQVGEPGRIFADRNRFGVEVVALRRGWSRRGIGAIFVEPVKLFIYRAWFVVGFRRCVVRVEPLVRRADERLLVEPQIFGLRPQEIEVKLAVDRDRKNLAPNVGAIEHLLDLRRIRRDQDRTGHLREICVRRASLDGLRDPARAIVLTTFGSQPRTLAGACADEDGPQCVALERACHRSARAAGDTFDHHARQSGRRRRIEIELSLVLAAPGPVSRVRPIQPGEIHDMPALARHDEANRREARTPFGIKLRAGFGFAFGTTPGIVAAQAFRTPLCVPRNIFEHSTPRAKMPVGESNERHRRPIDSRCALARPIVRRFIRRQEKVDRPTKLGTQPSRQAAVHHLGGLQDLGAGGGVGQFVGPDVEPRRHQRLVGEVDDRADAERHHALRGPEFGTIHLSSPRPRTTHRH